MARLPARCLRSSARAAYFLHFTVGGKPRLLIISLVRCSPIADRHTRHAWPTVLLPALVVALQRKIADGPGLIEQARHGAIEQ